MRAVKDYNGFLKNIPFDKDTVDIIRVIITDEEVHIVNWKKASELFTKKKPTSK